MSERNQVDIKYINAKGKPSFFNVKGVAAAWGPRGELQVYSVQLFEALMKKQGVVAEGCSKVEDLNWPTVLNWIWGRVTRKKMR